MAKTKSELVAPIPGQHEEIKFGDVGRFRSVIELYDEKEPITQTRRNASSHSNSQRS